MKNVLLYCRPGFEKDCAGEITELAAMHGFYGYVRMQPKQGFVLFVMERSDAGELLIDTLSFSDLIFARQIIAVNDEVSMGSGGRVEALLDAAKKLPLAQDLWIETADTNEGKGLAGLIKKTRQAVTTGLEESELIEN